MTPKCSKFTAEELHYLLQVLELNYQWKYITSSDSNTRLHEISAWKKIADEFNALCEMKSTADTLSSKWRYCKHKVLKKCFKIRKRFRKYPPNKKLPVRLSFTEKRILSIIGSHYVHEFHFDSESEAIRYGASGSNPLIQSTVVRAPYLVLENSAAGHKSNSSYSSNNEMSPPASPSTEANVNMLCDQDFEESDASGFDKNLDQISYKTSLLPCIVSTSSLKDTVEETPKAQDYTLSNILTSVAENVSNSVMTPPKPQKRKIMKPGSPVVLVSRLSNTIAALPTTTPKKKSSSNGKKIKKAKSKSKGKFFPKEPQSQITQDITQELQTMNHYLSSIALTNLEIAKYMKSMGEKQEKIILLLSAALNIDDV